jgi:hypothetical protein
VAPFNIINSPHCTGNGAKSEGWKVEFLSSCTQKRGASWNLEMTVCLQDRHRHVLHLLVTTDVHDEGLAGHWEGGQ